MSLKSLFKTQIESSIGIEAPGGLGNQLFVYAAGRFLAEKMNLELKINLSPVGLAGNKHGIYIDKLGLKGNFYYKAANTLQYQNLVFRMRFYISKKSEIFRIISNKFSSIYLSKGVGFDDYLFKVDQGIKIRGYFQTYKYLENILDLIQNEIEVIKPSNWFKEMSSQFQSNPPVVMHIRLGDSLSKKSAMRVLSYEYYIQGINNLPKTFLTKPIWCFSDDIESAKKLIQPKIDYKLNWIQTPPETAPTESLILMSMGCVNIISNSTFSWWGAVLNRNSPIVIAPKNWFKSKSTNMDLFPNEWILLDNK